MRNPRPGSFRIIGVNHGPAMTSKREQVLDVMSAVRVLAAPEPDRGQVDEVVAPGNAVRVAQVPDRRPREGGGLEVGFSLPLYEEAFV